MKNKLFFPVILMLGVATLAFTGCAGEEDDIFSASAAERLNESSAKYSARLEAQPNGWAMQYYPTYQDASPYGSGYLILMDFNPDFSVRVAMDNAFTGNAFACDTSVWEVITDNGPVLSFNSYNYCMHAFSDPEDIPWTSDSEQSEGCGGDYEFIVVDAPEDASYMMLKGKKRGTYNLLTPIEEGVDYQEYLADVKAFHNRTFSAISPVGNFIHFGDTIYNMEDAEDGLPSIFPLGADKITFENFNPFLITKRGGDYYLRFRDAFQRDDMDGVLQEMRYDSLAQEFIGTDNAAFRITGYPPMRFFLEKVDRGDTLTLQTTSTMSEKFKTYVNDLSADIASIKGNGNRPYGFAGLNFYFLRSSQCYMWDIRYRVPGASKPSFARYLFDFTRSDDQFAFSYISPQDDDVAAKNLIERLPSISAIMNILSQEFVVTGAISPFNLSQLKLTSVNDPELWFVISAV